MRQVLQPHVILVSYHSTHSSLLIFCELGGQGKSKARNSFPDIFNKPGVRGKIHSLDPLGELLLIQTRRLLVSFASRMHWFMSSCLFSGLNKDGCSLRNGRLGAGFNISAYRVRPCWPVSIPHYQSEVSRAGLDQHLKKKNQIKIEKCDLCTTTTYYNFSMHPTS